MSAPMNGGKIPRRGSIPAPAIIPRSMSRTVQTPSWSTRHDSTTAFSFSSSASASPSGSASPSSCGSPFS